MTIAPHTIQAATGARTSVTRYGRGHGSGRGTTAGRGTKGQRARSGGRSRTAIRPFKRQLQKVPKLRGFVSQYPRPEVVTLGTLERIVAIGEVVTPAYLKAKHVIDIPAHGVKILGTGMLSKKITVEGCLASKSAVAAIEKAGGSVVF